jgi:hypothetical protein
MLARQLLLERKRLSATAVIERLVGIQAQWPSAPYVGIWTRAAGFRRQTLERLIRSGTVLKATMMRQTLHLVTRRDYALVRSAMSETNFPWDWPQVVKLAPKVRALAVDGELHTSEALPFVERRTGLTGIDARRMWRYTRVQAHILQHPDSAMWRARPDGRYVTIDPPTDTFVPVEARAEMLRRYLAAFGPSTKRDMNTWSMMKVPEITRALELLEPLVRYRDEQGRELLDVPRPPLPDPGTPAPVRFLPKWDNVLLAWADRTRILPERYRKTVIRVNGDVLQTFLVDGFVAGTWSDDGGRVVVQPFEKLSRATAREVTEEAERLEAFIAD